MTISTDGIKETAKRLKAGDRVTLSGYVYTARDAAHKKLFEILNSGQELPFEIKGAIIYYAGPTEKPDNLPIGSCGPTTSGRMDKFSPRLLDLGLGGMIGKGERNRDVCEAIKRNDSIYFAAIGGAGALAAACIKSVEIVAFPELGCESIKRLYIEEFPLIAAIDAAGNNIYTDNPYTNCTKY